MALSKIRSDSLEDTAIHGNRNLVINGAMQVAQRGTSFSSITANVYPVDRFFVRDVNSAAGEATVSQSTTTPDDFKNSLKIDVTTADTSLVAADQYKIEYRAEGQDVSHLNWGTSAAKTVTLSFWIRSNKTGNTQVGFMNGANNRAYVATFTIDTADTWEKKELTVAGDTSGTWLNTNGIGLRLRWGSFGSTYQTSSVNQWVGANVISRDDSPINFFDSTDNELYLTGIQLEVGEQATPFEHRSYGDELAACQRYFTSSNGNKYEISWGGQNSGSIAGGQIDLPVHMRADCTVSTEDDSGNSQRFTTLTGGASLAHNNGFNVLAGYTNSIYFRCYGQGLNGMRFIWEADAEL